MAFPATFFYSSGVEKNQSWQLWALLAASYFVIWALVSNKVLPIEHEKFLNPPPELIEHFHFGFSESMADSLWLRWIQDSDFCQTYMAPVQEGTHYMGADDPRLTKNPRHRICDNSWGFKMLDAITKLAPRFLMPYEAGGITLAVLIEDYEGATVIFERGIEIYPNDWNLAYRAAYHFLFDKQDLPRAAALLVRAGENGAPEWVKSLAARLYEKSGQLELGVSALEAYKATLSEEKSIREVNARIQALKERLSK